MNEKETNLTKKPGKLKSAGIILLKTLFVILALSLIVILAFRYFPTVNDMGKTVIENWFWFLLWRVILYVVAGYFLFKLGHRVPPENKKSLIKLIIMLIVVIEATSVIQILRG